MTHVLRALLVVLATIACNPGVALAQVVPGPACYIGFVGDLRQVIGDAADADDFFRMIHAFNPTALRGTSDALRYVGADRFHGMFDIIENLRNGSRMPFRTDEDLFEAVAGLSARADAAGGMPGLNSIVGNLAGNENNAQGAAFSLFMAKRLANDGTDYSRIRAFEFTMDAGGRGRRYDVVDASGRRYENKSWTQGLPSAGSSASLEFMDEFRADIIIDGANGFNLTHYNFHDSVAGGLADLRARLMSQFDAQEVIDALGDQLGTVRTAFGLAWDQGRLYSLHGF